MFIDLQEYRTIVFSETELLQNNKYARRSQGIPDTSAATLIIGQVIALKIRCLAGTNAISRSSLIAMPRWACYFRLYPVLSSICVIGYVYLSIPLAKTVART